MNEQEVAFIRHFIVENRQQRYLGFISTSRHRKKFLREMYHRLDIKRSLAKEVKPSERTVENVARLLVPKGALQVVYVISPDSEIDQTWMPLSEALRIAIDDCTESIVCCKLGELAFYRSEDSAWVLHYVSLGSGDIT